MHVFHSLQHRAGIAKVQELILLQQFIFTQQMS